MQKLFFASTLTLTIVAATAACTEPNGTIVDSSAEQAVDESTITIFGSAAVDPLPNDATEESHRAALTRYGAVRAAVIDAISAGGTTDAVDTRVRNVLAGSGTFAYRPYVEQYAACRLLELWLSEDSPASVARIEQHASTLLHHANPDASLLLMALTELRQIWSEARIREAARKTMVEAARWSQKVCPECYGKDGVRHEETNPAVARKRAEVIEATEALELLAGP